MPGTVNFLLDTFYLKRAFNLLKDTFSQWSDDKAPQLGASLAYYTVLSLAPLILLVMSISALALHNNETLQTQLREVVSNFGGKSSGDVVGDIVKTNASQPKRGVVATVLGAVVALFGASGVFGALQDALNTIWGVKAKPGLGVMGYLKARFTSFAMVGGVCFILLVLLGLTVTIKGLSDKLDHLLPGGAALSTVISILVNIVVITVLFAMIFKFLPDAKISWGDVWLGAGITTLLFIVGKYGLALYLGGGSAGSAYGAAGAIITTLIWVYYSAQILLFGAEFTQVFANEFGTHIEPVEHAVRVEKKEIEIPNPSKS